MYKISISVCAIIMRSDEGCDVFDGIDTRRRMGLPSCLDNGIRCWCVWCPLSVVNGLCAGLFMYLGVFVDALCVVVLCVLAGVDTT